MECSQLVLLRIGYLFPLILIALDRFNMHNAAWELLCNKPRVESMVASWLPARGTVKPSALNQLGIRKQMENALHVQASLVILSWDRVHKGMYPTTSHSPTPKSTPELSLEKWATKYQPTRVQLVQTCFIRVLPYRTQICLISYWLN